ncbi:hypothetical protein DYB35_000711, partial [Aphanomyces astaci]
LLKRSFAKKAMRDPQPVNLDDDDDDLDDDDEDFDEDEYDFDDGDVDFDLEDQLESMEDFDEAMGDNANVKEEVKRKVSVRRAKHSKRKFVDRIRIRVKGGMGGNGCTSFVSTFSCPMFERWNEDLDDYETVDRLENLVDLDQSNAEFMAAVGGKPGLGSRILAGKTTKFGGLRKVMPEGKNMGLLGTSNYLELELKTIADVGLVGYPNAGKSTLLRALSKATPEVAPYPFTTLHPNVGVVEFPDTYRYSVADLPGLIEGAHRNVGLGHSFLRHIERTKVLLYVLDTAGSEGRDPVDDFHHLQNELELYAPNITSRPSLIAANKMDAPGADVNIGRLKKVTGLPIVPLSALHKVDIKILASSVRWMIENYKSIED